MTLAPILDFPPEPGAGDLFGLLWPQIEPLTSRIVQEPWVASRHREYEFFANRLIEYDGNSVPADIIAYLRGEDRRSWTVPASEIPKRAFIVMRAIDRACRRLLPAVPSTADGAVFAAPGSMMRQMGDRLLLEGTLADTSKGHVILRGPLSAARSKEPQAGNGDNFADQFSNLTLLPHLAGGRTLSFQTFTAADFHNDEQPVETVGIAPIAEDSEDLHFATEERDSRCYLDAVPADPARIADRMVRTVVGLLNDGAELIALPELVSCPDAVKAVRAALQARRGAPSGRVVMLGSGLSEESVAAPGGACALRYNEAVVLDGRGKLLFRQRKLHHYSMSPDRMSQCGITPIKDEGHLENAAAGHVLELVDLPGVGRLMVLICEDFAQLDPGGIVVARARPDWIIVPVLDIPQRVGRWPHQSAFAKGAGARIVVSCSATLGVRQAGCTGIAGLPPEAGIGVLFDGTRENAIHIIEIGSGATNDTFRAVKWDSKSWNTTRLGAAPR